MTTLISLLRQARPRRIPLHPQKGCTSIVYADAYFRLGERLWKVGQGHASPKHWTRQATTELENGWGFLVKTGDVVSAAHGRVPAEIFRLFSSRKAYIFFPGNPRSITCLHFSGAESRPWVGLGTLNGSVASLTQQIRFPEATPRELWIARPSFFARSPTGTGGFSDGWPGPFHFGEK